MKQRGRQSAASVAVIGAGGIETVRRPNPPHDLSDEQAEEWRAVVNQLPADWFPRETHQLLAQYCRHVVAGRRVAQLIASEEAAEEFDVERYDRLLKMQEREGRAMTSLATKMRMSQQATYDREKKKPRQVSKPWQG